MTAIPKLFVTPERFPKKTTRNPQAALVDLQAQLYAEVRAVGRPVPQLMTALLDRRNLEVAWDRVRSNDGANTPGVDGMTCKDLERSAQNGSAINAFLSRLADDLLHDRYQPQPPRWVEIPKNSGGTRRLGILTIRDRIVQVALKQVFEPILDPIFHPDSFGFRPGRSVPAALTTAVNLLAADHQGNLPFPFGLHLDVANCFDTIDHDFLLQTLTQHVGDPAILRLVRQVLEAGGTTVRRWFRHRHIGLVQGGALSPLLCNLALNGLDQALAEMRSTTQDGIRVLRYADDLLLLSRTPNLAHQALALIRNVLDRLGQRLRDPKASVSDLHAGVQWLGVRLNITINRWTGRSQPGYSIPDEKVKTMLDRVAEITTPPSSKITAQAFDLGQWILSINEQLREWHQAYQFADNLPEVVRTIDECTLTRVQELLTVVTGMRHTEVRRQYRVRLPRAFWTWQVNGVRLVVLASLAPRRPGQFLFPPPWLQTRPQSINATMPKMVARTPSTVPAALAVSPPALPAPPVNTEPTANQEVKQ